MKNVKRVVNENAIVRHVHSVLIFPRVHLKSDMLTGASTVSIVAANPTGCSN